MTPQSKASNHARLSLRPGCPITRADLDVVQRLRPDLTRSGYRVVAVHSPWSEHVAPDSAGKQPLTEVRDGQKHPWTEGHSLERLAKITRASANTGVVLGGVPHLVALDLDPAKNASGTEQQAFVLGVLRLLRSDVLWPLLVGAPMRLRPPASVVVVFRTEMPMTKAKVQGTRGAVELLGDGQHVVVHGWHPRSLGGTPVCWRWRGERTLWSVPASDLPIIASTEVRRLMDCIAASGALGERLRQSASTRGAIGQPRAGAYEATTRLRELFERHDGLVRPAIRELIAEVGREGCGRHDTLVAVTGRLAHQHWSDGTIIEFLVPLANEFFLEGDWSGEVEAALQHAREKTASRVAGVKGVRWS